MSHSDTFRVKVKRNSGLGASSRRSYIRTFRCGLLQTAIKLILVASSLSAVSQPPTPQDHAITFTKTIWRSQDGLPENQVQALLQDRDGYLWVGTSGGLARFDGARFSPLNEGEAQSIFVNNFYCLMLSHDGTLWAGTDGGGLLHIDQKSGRIRAYAAPDGLTDAFVHSIFEDSSGRIWVGSESGLFVKEDDRLVRIDPPGAHGTVSVQALAEDRENHILAGGSHLFSLGAGQNQEITLPGVYGRIQVECILEAGDGTLWVGTTKGLFRQINGVFQRAPEFSGVVRSLRQTGDGTILVGTISKGLWAFRGGKFTRIGDKGLLPIDTVLSIFEDGDHRIWVGTQNGLVRLERSQISLIPLPGFDNDYGTISGTPAGDIWMVAWDAFQVSGGVATPLKFPGLLHTPIRSLYRAKDGSTWVGTDGRGVYHLPGSSPASFSGAARHYMIGNFIRGFLESSRGEIWIATDVGLFRIAAKGVTSYGIADGLAHFNIKSLCEDRNHDIWVGTDRGLSRWHDGSFVQDTATAALRDEKVWSILQDRRGALWFGTRNHGLFRYRNNTVEHYTTAQGLLSNIVYQLLQDRTGRFWISSAETISSLPEEEMDGDPLHFGRPLSVNLYRMPDGADGVQLSGGRFPSGYLAPDDTVWFPTNRGAAHIVVNDERVEGPPVVRIAGILRDGENLSASQNFDLPARTARFALSFSPLFLGPQNGIRFRYQLEGFDHGWISAGAGHIAMYTNLPAGNYRFRVQSFDLSHPELTTEATLAFSKKPFLYQTWWFRLGCILVLAGCGLVAYWARLRKIKNRFAVVLEERGRLAREMHDTVIQGCTGVAMLLEGIATQRESDSEDDDLLNFAREQLRATINEARQAVWNLRRNDEEEIDLSQSLTTLAELATGAFGIPVMCDRVDPVSGISGLIGHELLMAAREAIANAGTHAHPDWIRISASLNGMDLTVSITDNGCGFNQKGLADGAAGHYGLVGMRERMQKIGGTLMVHSISGGGTEVVMKLQYETAGVFAHHGR